MNKEDKVHFDTNWYELWMKQSKEFFESADKNLKEIFGKHSIANPEEHLKQVEQWLETLKKQWESSQLTKEQKAYQEYWKMMAKMYSDASDMMLQEWIKRSHHDNAIKNIRELYELWIQCCHSVYQKSLQSNAYQEAYGDFMNAAIKFWKDMITK